MLFTILVLKSVTPPFVGVNNSILVAPASVLPATANLSNPVPCNPPHTIDEVAVLSAEAIGSPLIHAWEWTFVT